MQDGNTIFAFSLLARGGTKKPPRFCYKVQKTVWHRQIISV